MKPEQQRIAIAEAYGWSFSGTTTHSPDGAFWESKGPDYPDYLNDLNACHEMVETLDRWQRGDYAQHLMEVCMEHPIGTVPDYDSDRRSLTSITQATPKQKCEAFLKTLNLWEVSE